MSFNPEAEILNTEILFRAFRYDQWDFEEDRVTSGVFKSTGSVSVDRDGERKEPVIISAFRERKNYTNCGIVRNLASFYREINATLTPSPIFPDNIYHTLVDKENGIGTTNSMAKKLSRNSSLVILAVSK